MTKEMHFHIQHRKLKKAVLDTLCIDRGASLHTPNMSADVNTISDQITSDMKTASGGREEPYFGVKMSEGIEM